MHDGLPNAEIHLAGQLRGNGLFEAAQHERPQRLVQAAGYEQRLLLAQQHGLFAVARRQPALRQPSAKPAQWIKIFELRCQCSL